jgi:hypothetical protein
MARGGYRPGAGRPPKPLPATSPAKDSKLPAVCAPSEDDLPTIKLPEGAVEPLAYMLAVMNDPDAEVLRRDRMAIAAAPFRHPRLERVTESKKEAAAQTARKLGVGKFAPGAVPKLIVNNG